MASSRVLVRGALLLMLSIGILAAPLVLTVGGTGNARAEQPAITLSLSGPAAAASNAMQPPGATSTPGNAPAGKLVSYRAAPLQAPLTNIVISEFDTHGLGGDADEFIELFNPTSATVSINGWSLWRSNCSGGQSIITGAIPSGVSLNPGQYYLVGGLSYPGAYDGSLVNIGVADTGGIALVDNSAPVANLIDRVGFCADASDFSEGTPLTTPLTGTADQSYERKFGGPFGSCLDNGDNLTDFAPIGPSSPLTSSSTPRPCVYPGISGNVGVAGATLSYVEGLATPKTVTADGTGAYTIQVADGWSGNVTPSLTGYTFAPPSTTYTNVTANATGQNYTATAVPPIGGNTPTPDPWPQRSVIINEVGWAGTGAQASDEWIELYHPGSGTIYLEGWRLVGSDAGGLRFDITLEDSGTDIISIGPNAYLVLTANDSVITANAPPPWVLTDSNFGLVDTGMTLYLYDPGGAEVDTANKGVGGIVGAWPAGSTAQRRSMERINSAALDSQTNWATFSGTPPTSSWPLDADGNAVYGSPGRANQVLTVTVTPRPSATPTSKRKPTPVPPTPFAHMVINEFLPRAGTDWNQDGKINVYDEFIELKNLGPIDVDLKNWKLDVEGTAALPPFTLTGPKLSPGGRVIFYGSTTKLLQEDSGGTVRLINPRGVVIDARGYGPVADPDQSHCRMPDGYYWTHPCFPTPGLENSLKGTAPSAPPVVSAGPPPCLLADSVPAPFRQAECNPYGASMWDETYWDRQAGQSQFRVPDFHNKATTIVQ